MKQKIEHHHRRMKLPPILEIDEDGLPVYDMETWPPRRWSSADEDDDGAFVPREWPIELDD